MNKLRHGIEVIEILSHWIVERNVPKVLWRACHPHFGIVEKMWHHGA